MEKHIVGKLQKGNKGGVCACLHFLIGEFMSAGSAGFPIQILLWVHHLLRSVLMLVNAGVFSPDTAPHRPPQFCRTNTPTTHSESTEVHAPLTSTVDVCEFSLKIETNL